VRESRTAEPAVFTRRDVHQGLRRHTRFANPDNLDAPLKLLEHHGYIRAVTPQAARGPGHLTVEYEKILWGCILTVRDILRTTMTRIPTWTRTPPARGVLRILGTVRIYPRE
jgi:hypothetical protein